MSDGCVLRRVVVLFSRTHAGLPSNATGPATDETNDDDDDDAPVEERTRVDRVHRARGFERRNIKSF